MPARPSVERLETRWVPNASPLASASSLQEIEPNETIDQAHDLGGLTEPVVVVGSIGNGPAGAADVTWYEFELGNPARVDFKLTTPAENPPFASVLSLYNNDPEDFGDPFDPSGHRLLTQVEANRSTGAVDYDQNLGPGDYFVAISGAGNLDFSPVVAGSGFDGATGIYELSLSATDLGLSGAGPTVLSSDPASGAVLDGSPLAIRLEMSGPLNPGTIVAGQSVQLLFRPVGATAGDAGTSVGLSSVNFSAAANELQLFPAAPLAPGDYTVSLAGDSSMDQAVLAAPDGIPLGEDAAHPAGADYSMTFQVDGIDGVAGASGSDDSAATAHQLGDVAGAGLIQVNGAIGVDPSFNPSLSPDPTNPEPQFSPANQVDLYQFEITEPGRYALLAEVFCGRIGSRLDPGISLFELDPSTGLLVFLAGNNNTLDPTQGTDGSIPLLTDSALTAGLCAGDYFLAVAGGANTPSPLEGQPPGSPGIYNPNQPGSAQNGWSVGPYVLNLMVQAAPEPPRVLASSPSSGEILDEAPQQITVQFSEPIDLEQLAFEAFETSPQGTLPQVFIEGADWARYYPRFVSYNRATNQAIFQMLDGLPNGSYTLHLSGPGGLADLGGNPIAGNDPSGDHVIPFQVQGPARGISGNMTDGYTFLAQPAEGIPQNLGVLFPDELQAGVTINRLPENGTSPAPPSISDQYIVQLLQNQTYSFSLSGSFLPVGAQVTLTNEAGQPVPLLASYSGQDFFAPLAAGTYTVTVNGWTAGQSANVSYQLTMDLVGQQDNAPPLVAGPAPLLQIHLESATGTTASAPTAGSESGGHSTPTLPGSSGLVIAQNAGAGSLTSLGASPLGGVATDAAPVAAGPVPVALGLPVTQGLGGLVSLVTLTQVMPWSSVGEGLETGGTVEQVFVEASDWQPPELLTRDSATIIRPDTFDSESAMIDAMQLAGASAPRGTAAPPVSVTGDPGPPVGYDRPRAAATAAIVDEEQPAEWVLVPRLVMTGAIVAIAVRQRITIRGLKWRKAASADRPRSACPISRRPSHGMTVTFRPRSIGHALSRGRAARSASGSSPET